MRKRIFSSLLVVVAMLLISAFFSANASAESFTIHAAGDCTFSSDIKQPSYRNFYSMYKKKGPAYFFKKVKDVFKKDTLSIVNFEGTVSNRGSRVNKQWAFRGKPKYTKILKEGSIEAVGLANNHIRDYGEVSYQDTKKTLSKSGILYSSEAIVSIKEAKGIKVGMISISSIDTPKEPFTTMKKAFKKVKKLKPDFIIVNIHSGTEYTKGPNSAQTQLAHFAVNKGADLVIGHHPHVVQPIEKYKGVYIAYSLGNFCFGGNTNPSDKDCLILEQKFTIENGKKSRSGTKIIPCRLSSHDSYNDYQPKVCKKSQKKVLLARMRSYCKSFKVKITKTGKLS